MKNILKKITGNKRFKRLWLPALALVAAVAVVVLLYILTGDKPTGSDETDEPTQSSVVATQSPAAETSTDDGTDPEDSPAPPPVPILYNTLTGEPLDEDISSNRPFGVAIGNTSAALPQFGIGQADLLIEYCVESGITRFMAVYKDLTDVGEIGGIRSFRESSLHIAKGFDIIFTHWIGMSYTGVEAYGDPITRFDTVDASKGRTGFRKNRPNYDLEHTAFTTGERLTNAIPDDFRTQHEAGFEHTLHFTQDGTPKDGRPAQTVVAKFLSNSKTTTFNYNEETGKYTVRQFGRDLIDGSDNKKISFTNVIIMQANVIPDYNTMGHTFIDSDGTHTGYFICGGKYTEITWSREKKDETTPFYFYNKDGNPLELGIGKTFICIVDKEVPQTFS